tara:strand:- start:11461 stop:12711 length:1251 start_codon:yes stop_codon:yes gene_type:complete
MNLLKTSALNGISVLIKTVTMFVLNKILAVYVGPSGYAAIGQFQNFIQIITAFAGSSINTAVVKYTAEYYEDESKQRAIWKTAGTLVVLFSTIVAFFILIFQRQLSLYIFKTTEYQSIFVWFAVFLLFFNFNTLFLSILNGKKEISKLVIANIAGSLVSLAVTGLLAIKFGLYGALVALTVNQSIVFFVTLLICYKSKWFRVTDLFGKIDPGVLKKLSSFGLMAIVSIVFGNLAQIILRNIIIADYDLNHAGYWDAMTRLSGGYLMFASTILSVYYLPRLSELKRYKDIKQEVNYGYKVILPLACLMSLSIYLFQDFIIGILFTKEFLPMKELMFWQLLGDVIKIGSWIVSFMMLSKAMTKIFIITEAFFALSIIPLSIIFIRYFGFKGIAMAFALNCLLYWIVCSYFSFRKLREV